MCWAARSAAATAPGSFTGSICFIFWTWLHGPFRGETDLSDNNTITVRPVEDADLGDIVALDEKVTGNYRPAVWEKRLGYYMRRDPEASVVAVSDGRVLGFMFGEVRSGEFGLEEPTGWIEVLGVDPAQRGKSIGRQLADHMLAHFKGRGATKVRTLVDGGMDEIAGFFTSRGFEPAPLRAFVRTLR